MMCVRPIAVWQGPFSAARHAEFVASHWQKQPVLIRGLLSPEDVDTLCPLSVNSLLELSTDPRCSSRLIRESGGDKPWESRRGPFSSSALDELPKSDLSLPWTLLVSGVDQHVEAVEALRESPELWGFAPRWRIDDVQVSHAPPGGSVGAHVDNFDVFLLQGRGTRQWSVEGTVRSADDESLVPGLDVRILEHFEPSATWELSPGDALYLPPRFAHHGVSTSSDCLTYSIGFRAPSRAELLLSFAEHAASRLAEDDRYTDADLPMVVQPQRRGAIEPHTTRRIRALLRRAMLDVLDDDEAFEEWVGEPLTSRSRYARPGATAAPRAAGTPGPQDGAALSISSGDGPEELGPAARRAMEEWIQGLEAGEGAGEGADEEGERGGGVTGETGATGGGNVCDDEATLEAELIELMAAAGEGDDGDAWTDEEADDDEGGEDIMATAQEPLPGDMPSDLVAAIMAGRDESPTALRLAEGAAIAFIEHSNPGPGGSGGGGDDQVSVESEPRSARPFAPRDVVKLRMQRDPNDDGLRGIVAEVGERGCTIRLLIEGSKSRFFPFEQLVLADDAPATKQSERQRPPLRASVFVNGACVATVHDAAAIFHLPLLCSSSRVETKSLAAPLGESVELQQLVESFVQRDIFWVEL